MLHSIAKETVVTEVHHCNRAPEHSELYLSHFILLRTSLNFNTTGNSKELFAKQVGDKT